MLSKELKFILALSKTAADGAAAVTIWNTPGQAFDWEKMCSLSIAHGTAPLVYRAIISSLPLKNVVPDKILEKLKEFYYANLLKNLKLWREFCDIEEGFTGHCTRIIPLKGIILGHTLYHNPALRCIVADIDFLIRQRDINVGCAVMKNLGYTQISYEHRETAQVFRKGGFMVEMHWLFLPPSLSRINMETVWKNAKENTIDNRTITALSWEDTLLTLPLQVRPDWPFIRISRFSDINEIITQHGKELNWEYIATKAEEWHLTGPLYFSLNWCKEFFSTDSTKQQLRIASFGYLKSKFLSNLFKKNMPLLLLLPQEEVAFKKIKPRAYGLKLFIFIDPRDLFSFLRLFFSRTLKSLYSRGKKPE